MFSTIHNGGFLNFGGNVFEGVTQQDDVHGRHTHGNDDQPFVVHDADGAEDGLRIQIVEVLGDNTGGEPHREHEEEIEGLAEKQTLLAQRVGAQNGNAHGPQGTVEREEQGVGIGIPEHVILEHAGKGLELDLLGEKHDLAVFHGVTAGNGGGNSVDEGIETTQRKHCEQRAADDTEDQFGYFQFSFHVRPSFRQYREVLAALRAMVFAPMTSSMPTTLFIISAAAAIPVLSPPTIPVR